MRYKALLNDEEVRLVTILPASGEDETLCCRIEHFNISNFYHTEAFQHHLSSTGTNADVRLSWLEYSKRQKDQELGDDWVDVEPLVDDVTKHLPLPQYKWGDYFALSYKQSIA